MKPRLRLNFKPSNSDYEWMVTKLLGKRWVIISCGKTSELAIKEAYYCLFGFYIEQPNPLKFQ